MRLVLFFIVFMALPVSAQVKFLQLGDPQLGRGCMGGPTYPEMNYHKMTYTDCMDRQVEQLKGILDFGLKKEIDFAWFMGDMVEAGASQTNYNKIKAVIDEYQGYGMTFKFTPGNHDYENNCSKMYRWIIDNYQSGSVIRNPMWDSWVINNVHFFSANSGLWGVDRNDCAGLSSVCRDISYTNQGACVSDGDADGYGTTCATDGSEVCEDYGGWATDMMTAFEAFVTNYESSRASGAANAIIAGGHYPWTRFDDIVGSPGDSFMYYPPWIDDIEIALNGTVTTDTHPFIWLSGHAHQNWCCGLNCPDGGCEPVNGTGTTDLYGVKWVVWLASGTAANSLYPNEQMAGRYWEVGEDGIARQKLIFANGQRGSL